MLFVTISQTKTFFVALFNIVFQKVLSGQLILSNSCLLIHSILVGIKGEIQLWEAKIDLVSRDVQIIKSQIIGLYFIKWKMWIAHGKKN